MDFNQQVIDEFRANAGRVGGPFEHSRLILLTTTGARTGAAHTTPVGYLPDGAERIVVIGSAGGSPRHPAWYHNLVATPRVTVEDGLFTYEADATVLTGPERDEIFARAVEADRAWADYETRSGRRLPVVGLARVGDGPPRGSSFGDVLRRVHDAFRRELSLIREEFADTGGTGIGVQLRVNCLTVCEGLRFHHRMEDGGVFPALEERFPESSTVLARLRAEHETISGLVGELGATVRGGSGGQAEVERLIDELEAHLAYEEEQLIPLIDQP